MADEKQQYTAHVEQLADKDTRYEAWKALKSAGQEAVDALREGLSHPTWKVRQFCAMLLDEHWDVPALQRLTLALHDPKLKVRRAAVHSLGCDRCKNGENPIDVLPYVEERLREDKSIKVRRMAVLTLAIQAPNKRIARVLRRALRDETDLKLRRFAQWGLKRYDESVLSLSEASAAGESGRSS